LKLFPIKKNINVGTFRLPNNSVPKFVYKDFKLINKNEFNCPSVGSMNNRMYEMDSMFDIEIEFGLKNNEPYYNYRFNTDVYKNTIKVHEAIGSLIRVEYDNDIVTLQFITDSIIVTDDKDLELILLPPLETPEIENCKFVSGSFYPYAWLRNLNSSYVLSDNSKPGSIKLSMDKPLLTVLFNKPINLKEIKPTNEMFEYHQYMFDIVSYRKKINNIFPFILSKRPKKFLS